jgi:hypothetical protein
VFDVCRESFEKFSLSLEAEMLAYRENVVSINVQLVNGMKNPSQSMYMK